jgi:hypothetical protein
MLLSIIELDGQARKTGRIAPGWRPNVPARLSIP